MHILLLLHTAQAALYISWVSVNGMIIKCFSIECLNISYTYSGILDSTEMQLMVMATYITVWIELKISKLEIMFMTDAASKLYQYGFRSMIHIKANTENLMPAVAF